MSSGRTPRDPAFEEVVRDCSHGCGDGEKQIDPGRILAIGLVGCATELHVCSRERLPDH